MEKTSIQSDIASYVGKLLRDHFGKGPSSVYVSINKPFVTLHIRGFLAPMERVLIAQQQELKVEEVRDHLMEELIPDLKVTLTSHLGESVKELFYDWSLENSSGMILCVLDNDQAIKGMQNYEEKEAIHEEVAHVSQLAEKLPIFVDSCFVNERTLLIKREGILVRIEKELIKNGFEEELKLTKKRLEKSLLLESNIHDLLQADIVDCYVDWDFEADSSYILFTLKK
ncbi:Na-translocating system protein MpsC family protein [Bacillus sp. JCM 19041]|uniref:Na-translocating system protein MpsC family protein n=1 Tax=Bacillus sp. JCM 19041 TaxID=1460637 RepID=UPI0006D293B0